MVNAVTAVVGVVEQTDRDEHALEVALAGGPIGGRRSEVAECIRSALIPARCRAGAGPATRVFRANVQVLGTDLVVRGNEKIAGVDHQTMSKLAVNLEASLLGIRHLASGFDSSVTHSGKLPIGEFGGGEGIRLEGHRRVGPV